MYTKKTVKAIIARSELARPATVLQEKTARRQSLVQTKEVTMQLYEMWILKTGTVPAPL